MNLFYMKKIVRNSSLFFLCACLSVHLHAADEEVKNKFSPLQTAIPSLTIAPDARGGSMGDNGAATLPDVNAQFWNPAKYAFMESKAGVSLSYTPWLRKLVSDVALAYLAGYYKVGQSDRSAVSASLRYFSLGEVPVTTYGGIQLENINPYEMAFDLGYSMKLSEAGSMAVTLRYIRSDMGADSYEDLQPANGFAADVSGYLEKYVYLGSGECLWSSGFNISNVGTKISFDGGNTEQFLPTNLKLGTGLLYPVDDYNQFGVYLDLNKYLVPVKPVKLDGEDQIVYEERVEKWEKTGFFTGIFKSFSDAPGGFSEELKEVNLSLGAEYSYNNQFFLRGGYHYEDRYKGNRQYFSAGAGFKMNVFQLDAAYLISTVQSNPLDQTLRFSLTFDMDGLNSLFQ